MTEATHFQIFKFSNFQIKHKIWLVLPVLIYQKIKEEKLV
jgi:hypothetical protein